MFAAKLLPPVPFRFRFGPLQLCRASIRLSLQSSVCINCLFIIFSSRSLMFVSFISLHNLAPFSLGQVKSFLTMLILLRMCLQNMQTGWKYSKQSWFCWTVPADFSTVMTFFPNLSIIIRYL